MTDVAKASLRLTGEVPMLSFGRDLYTDQSPDARVSLVLTKKVFIRVGSL